MRQTGNRSLEMGRRYIREGDHYRENAAAYLGLERAKCFTAGLLVSAC